jgi:Tol biopolymer transport system component
MTMSDNWRSTAVSDSPGPTRIVHRGDEAITIGAPIAISDLAGRIVTDDFENLFAMDPHGSNVVVLADLPGAEFDGAWSPDGRFVVYRDSTRGINEDDEIFVLRADGTGARNITNNPANDWGPDWSPDGSTIVSNSDREGGAARLPHEPERLEPAPGGRRLMVRIPGLVASAGTTASPTTTTATSG